MLLLESGHGFCFTKNPIMPQFYNPVFHLPPVTVRKGEGSNEDVEKNIRGKKHSCIREKNFAKNPNLWRTTRARDAGIDLVRMGDEAGLFWFELHSNVSNCNAWQISGGGRLRVGSKRLGQKDGTARQAGRYRRTEPPALETDPPSTTNAFFGAAIRDYL